jgi:hypothetical protein
MIVFIALAALLGYLIGSYGQRDLKKIKKTSDVILNVAMSQFDHQQRMFRHNLREMVKVYVPKDKQRKAIKEIEEAAPKFSKGYFVKLMEDKHNIKITK